MGRNVFKNFIYEKLPMFTLQVQQKMGIPWQIHLSQQLCTWNYPKSSFVKQIMARIDLKIDFSTFFHNLTMKTNYMFKGEYRQLSMLQRSFFCHDGPGKKRNFMRYLYFSQIPIIINAIFSHGHLHLEDKNISTSLQNYLIKKELSAKQMQKAFYKRI